ncbi:purine nucleoside permease [Neokomagataea tanensis]|uniref:Purine nucleoside permease n=2 Tax=Neokomagataea TaxID=1223423 RepID=A0A4Y6VBZ7_9PROT|nr:purine nucleoside permease [Neokomagataea tanensis]
MVSGHVWAAPIPVKVVVVATFEFGADQGDRAGEFQNWVEKLPLPQSIPAPGTFYGHMRYNPAMKVLGVVTGEGPEHASATMTALLTDPRFDLSHAYFLLAGIGGIDPNFGSVGSAVWAPNIINGGLSHQIDSREIPKDWPDGYTPIAGEKPDTRPVPQLHSNWGNQAYSVDPDLLQWAFRLTKDIQLSDNQGLKAEREKYVGYPKALAPPSVQQGDVIASPTFWTGRLMNAWAERWVNYWTEGKGVMATTAEEDLGFMQALATEAPTGRVDMRRILVLRTASNYDMPSPGLSAASMLETESQETAYPGLAASIEATYKVGGPVVREIVKNWDKYKNNTPK